MAWKVQDECSIIIREVWSRKQNWIQIKLLNCKAKLLQWIKAVKREVDVGKQDLALQIAQIQMVQEWELNDVNHDLQKEFQSGLEEEKLWWIQRAKQH